MGWGCKRCKFETSTKTDLLKHYRLHHGHAGQPQPCLYQDCFCSFKTWCSHRSHLSRNHSQETQHRVRSAESLSLQVLHCQCNLHRKRIFLNTLVDKKYETVIRVFKNCNLSTNIYGTFASHRSWKHSQYSLKDFKEDLLKRYASSSNTDDYTDVDFQDGKLPFTDNGQVDYDVRDLPNLIEKNLALLFLKENKEHSDMVIELYDANLFNNALSSGGTFFCLQEKGAVCCGGTGGVCTQSGRR